MRKHRGRPAKPLVASAILGLVPGLAFADVPSLMNYQGYLGDRASHAPVTGAVRMTFRLYADTTAAPVWCETHSSVAVNAGVFNVLLGSGTTCGGPAGLDQSLFSGPTLWLETAVNDTILVPRLPIVSAPYAFKAAKADVATSALSGPPGSGQWSETQAGDIYRPDGNIGIGTDSIPDARLDVFMGPSAQALNINAGYGDGVQGSYEAVRIGAAYGGSSTGSLTGLRVDVSNPGSGDTHAAVLSGGDLYLSTSGAALVRLEGVGPSGQVAVKLEADGGRNYSLNSRIGGSFDITDETTGASRFLISSNGDVAIGPQQTAAARLHVKSGSTTAEFEQSTTNGLVRFRDASTTDPPHIGSSGNDFVVLTGPGSTEKLRVLSNGYLSLTSPLSEALIRFSAASTVNAPHVGASGDNFVVLGGPSTSEIFRVNSDGNIGLGTPSPNLRLDIEGPDQNRAGIELSNTMPGAGTWQILSGNDNSLKVWSNSLQNYVLVLQANGEALFNGQICVTGAKNAIVPTSQGMTKLYCDESTEVRFSDSSRKRVRLVQGRATVALDPLFLETVTVSEEHPLEVWVTFHEPHGSYYVRTGAAAFEVIDDCDCDASFSWKVEAKRKGYEDTRLETTPLAVAAERR